MKIYLAEVIHNELQRSLNAATRLRITTKTKKFQHISPVLGKLHGLLVTKRIELLLIAAAASEVSLVVIAVVVVLLVVVVLVVVVAVAIMVVVAENW